MLKTVEKFIKGEVQKVSSTNKYIFLSNGEKFNSHKFGSACQIVRVYLNREKQLADKPKIEPVKIVGNENPINALRYIILRDCETEKYKMYFGTTQTSHSSLEEEFKKTKQKTEEDYICVAGGFYTLVSANAQPKDMNKPTIFLFGKSDSYGLRKEYLEEGIKTIPSHIDVKIVDSFSTL